MLAIVVAGGDPVPRAVLGRLPDASARELVVAADSGLDHARALGLAVDVVVGDLDSVDPTSLAAAREAGATVEQHPAAKDATDLELALDAAVARGATAVTVVGGHGGRLDHLLANVALLAADRYADVELVAWLGPARVAVARRAVALDGPVGSLCTLLAVGGPASGVRTEGLRFPLHGETLEPGSTRGVSNELLEPVARVELSAGTLVVVQPDLLTHHGIPD